MAEKITKGESPDILFWVGCAGSFDDRAKKITKALVKILNHCNVSFAVWAQKKAVLVIPQNELETNSRTKCKQ